MACAFEKKINGLLGEAIELGASDVHFQPLANGIRVFAKVDGEPVDLWRRVGQQEVQRLQTVLKRVAKMDAGLLNVPQGARFEFRDVDFRAQIQPNLFGEHMVLRVLPRRADWSLDAYAMPDGAKAALKSALRRHEGVILVCGPTSSGKTTLLYNALAEMDPGQEAVFTVEDPPEYRLAGVSQCPVTPRTGWAAMVKSLMRCAPDVVMVGEIRDAETAAAVVDLGRTGHLALASIHASSIQAAYRRFDEFGLKSEYFVDDVGYISSQRLLPRVCSACAVADEEGTARLARLAGLAVELKRGEGCGECTGTGRKGRVLAMEWGARGEMLKGFNEHLLELAEGGVIGVDSVLRYTERAR